MTLPSTDDQASVLVARRQDSFIRFAEDPFRSVPREDYFSSARPPRRQNLPRHPPPPPPRALCFAKALWRQDYSRYRRCSSFRVVSKIVPRNNFLRPLAPRRGNRSRFVPCFPERSKAGIKAEESLAQSTNFRAIELAGANLNESARISRVDGWKAKSGDLQVK